MMPEGNYPVNLNPDEEIRPSQPARLVIWHSRLSPKNAGEILDLGYHLWQYGSRSLYADFGACKNMNWGSTDEGNGKASLYVASLTYDDLDAVHGIACNIAAMWHSKGEICGKVWEGAKISSYSGPADRPYLGDNRHLMVGFSYKSVRYLDPVKEPKTYVA